MGMTAAARTEAAARNLASANAGLVEALPVNEPELAAEQATLRSLRFGVEIETYYPGGQNTGDGCRVIAERIAAQFGWTAAFVGGGYNKYSVTMTDGRAWTIMTDNSVTGGYARSAEIVSPILHWEDMETVQAVVRAARKAGAKIDSSCGIHVHVDGARFLAEPAKLSNLVKLIAKREGNIHDMLGGARRESSWCQQINSAFVADIDAGRVQPTVEALRSAWYTHNRGGYSYNRSSDHYDQSRYHGLNLHSLFYRGTIEFRYFGATLHAGKIRSYIVLCLALAAKSLDSRRATSKTANRDYRGCYWMLRKELNLAGEEFASVREHLMAALRAITPRGARRSRGRAADRAAA